LNPTPVLLMVLALLFERPMHPYEMQRIVAERGKNSVINIKRGSIYHAVERLQSAGLLDERETSRDGRRPERTVYQLTDSGRDELHAWMLAMLRRPKEEFPEFATVVSFLPVLEPVDVAGTLRQRIVMLDRTIGGLEATLRSIGDRMPRVFLIEEEYQLAMVRAERDWVTSLLDELDAGRFGWSWAELQRYGDSMASGPPKEEPPNDEAVESSATERAPAERDPAERDPAERARTKSGPQNAPARKAPRRTPADREATP
jgi:DNA-binding PadR family transcriptional regulator